jgi:hypothetical protein
VSICDPSAGRERRRRPPGALGRRAPIALDSHLRRGSPASARAFDYIRGSTRSPTPPRLRGDTRARLPPRSKEYENSSLLQKSFPRPRHDRPRPDGCASCFRKRTKLASGEGLSRWVRRREQRDARHAPPDENDPLPAQPRTACTRASEPALEPRSLSGRRGARKGHGPTQLLRSPLSERQESHEPPRGGGLRKERPLLERGREPVLLADALDAHADTGRVDGEPGASPQHPACALARVRPRNSHDVALWAARRDDDRGPLRNALDGLLMRRQLLHEPAAHALCDCGGSFGDAQLLVDVLKVALDG